MPNWCSNTLTIETSEKDIEMLKRIIETTKFGEMFIPFNNIIYDDDNNDLWRIDNWGTKWDINDAYGSSFENGYFQSSFETAWCPPIEAIIKLGEVLRHSLIELIYEEENLISNGSLIIKNNKIIENYEI